MPDCGHLHKFDIAQTGPNDYRIDIAMQGYGDIKLLIESTGLASTVVVDPPSTIFARPTAFNLHGVTDGARLAKFCETLKSTIAIDLTPEIDHCFALGPYSLVWNDNWDRIVFGSLVNRAKYRGDQISRDQLLHRFEDVIEGNAIFKNVTAISTPPKSDSSTPNLPRWWAERIASQRGWELIDANKTRQTSPQKNVDESDTEHEITVRLKGSVAVRQIPQGTKVLILDDTIRSGGTLKELARALKQGGAERIYGLSAAKDAKFTHGILLERESWP